MSRAKITPCGRIHPMSLINSSQLEAWRVLRTEYRVQRTDPVQVSVRQAFTFAPKTREKRSLEIN